MIWRAAVRPIYLLLLAASLLLAANTSAAVYQCNEGQFGDQPCADDEVPSLAASAPTEQLLNADGSAQLLVISSADAANDDGKPCDTNEFKTKAMIEQGLREWRVARCMSMEQVQKVTRQADYQTFSYTNGQQQQVIEWAYATGTPKRITFIDNRAVKLR